MLYNIYNVCQTLNYKLIFIINRLIEILIYYNNFMEPLFLLFPLPYLFSDLKATLFLIFILIFNKETNVKIYINISLFMRKTHIS